MRLVDPVQYRARLEDFDFDITIERFSISANAGQTRMRNYFSIEVAATKGSYNLAGIADPVVDALIEKIIGADRPQATLDHRLPRASTACCAPAATGCRNGSKARTGSPIGTSSVIRSNQAALCAASARRRPGGTIQAKAAKARAGEIAMSAYIARRILLMIPTLLGNPVRLLRRRAVRAGRAGRARDRAALRRRYRRAPRAFPARPAAISARAPRSAHRRRCGQLEISRRAGARSRFHQEAWKSSSASTSRRRSASR